MKQVSLAIAGAIFLAIIGCQNHPSTNSIEGTWEWTNFKLVDHVAHFKMAIVKFGSDGVCTSYFLNDEGDRIDQPTYRYHFDGVNMREDQDTNTICKVSIRGEEMEITFIRNSNQDNVGFTRKYKRLKE